MKDVERLISFRAPAGKIKALDSLAGAKDRPRSYLINEAIANYIDLHDYQDGLIRSGLEELRHGRVMAHEDVKKRIEGKRRRS